MTTPMPQHIAVAMLGARRNYAVPRALAAAGVLEQFFTDLLATRHPSGLPRGKTVTFPLFGIARALRRRGLRTRDKVLRDYLRVNRRFCDRILHHGLGNADAIYAFNAAALELFEDTSAPRVRILDQITAPWSIEEPLVAAERARWPDWEAGSVSESDWRPLADRESREWALADVIICGSTHVAACVAQAGGPAAKCRVVPYGVGATGLHPTPRQHEGPLRALFAGSLELRKGIPYLLEAARALPRGDVIFRAAGQSRLTSRALAAVSAHVEIRGAVPRSAIATEYAWADVLVLPSISEGSANVCYEAMACGLPVITTAESGSIVRDGMDGFIVPARSAGDIADRLCQLASERKRLRAMGDSAANRIREFSVEHYGEHLLGALRGDS